MFEYQGRTAIVTGASSGIGAEFAKVLAARGMQLVLTARSEPALQTLATELREKHKSTVHVVPLDLSREESVGELAAAVKGLGLEIDLLVNNAAFMTYGPLETIDPAKDRDQVTVNIAAVVGLTHAFLPGMLERRRGGILNLASVAAFQPIPYMAVYAASKAFILSFSVALREECLSRNVHIVALCPGTTSTNLFNAAAAPEERLGPMRTVQQVVATGLAALDKNRSVVVDGLKNMLLSLGPRLIPHWFAAKEAAKIVRTK